MIIAKQKKKENIAEYILYMWQVEDLLRACSLDPGTVRSNITSRFSTDAETLAQIEKWYLDLNAMMVTEHLQSSGHLSIVKNIVDDVEEFHLALLKNQSQMAYNVLFFNTLPVLSDFRARSKAGPGVGDAELSLNLMYEVLLLRLKGVDISAGTQDAASQVARLLAVLAQKYRQCEDGEIKID